VSGLFISLFVLALFVLFYYVIGIALSIHFVPVLNSINKKLQTVNFSQNAHFFSGSISALLCWYDSPELRSCVCCYFEYTKMTFCLRVW